MPEVFLRIAAPSWIAIALGIAPVSAAPPDPAARYVELVAAYAAGDRAVAVAGLGTIDESAIGSGMERLRGQSPTLVRAAAMLHTDRRLLERGSPDTPETRPNCESSHTKPAWQAVQFLMLDPAGTDFARRWCIAMALRDRWDGCFDAAFRWIDAGARWFPADPGILLARGALYETVAVLPTPLPRPYAIAGSQARQAALAATAERTQRLKEARRSLERALAADPALDMAQVRLGRVLWRLGEGDPARAALESVLARSRDDATLHLAHLFVARVHQDARSHDAALRAYRAALRLQPTSHAAAMGLSDALQLAGEPEEARAAVEGALAATGRRREPQSFWEYTFGDLRRATELLEHLREDVAR